MPVLTANHQSHNATMLENVVFDRFMIKIVLVQSRCKRRDLQIATTVFDLQPGLNALSC